MLSNALLWPLFLVPQTLVHQAFAFDAIPRWGQAVVMINDALYVHGGKTDEFNSFSYTAAPNSNDLLYLSLSSPFTGSSPPWELVSSSTNTSTSQGPFLAWHTVSAFNTSQALLFGGQPDPNSPVVLVSEPDSAALLDAWNRLKPQWITQPTSWASEPIRRLHHSSATIPSGLVFIFGGEKADGSNTAFSDHYAFDPNGPSFSLLPSSGAPPDICGHVSIPLPDGRILVFGGFSPSQSILNLLSMIWVLDTSKTPYTWSRLEVSSGSLPNSRRAFAAALIPEGKILIHGGSDALLQTNLDDGWILDLTTTPAIWSRVDPLSQLGARRDHFAISSGDQVIFGFGYGSSAPAPASLQVYDVPSGIFVPSYTPPTPPTSTRTLPPSSPTSTSGRPTSTNGATHSVTLLPDPSETTDPGGSTDTNGSKSKTTRIAVGTAFGFLALTAIVLGGAYFMRRKRRQRQAQQRFLIINDDDDDDDDGHHAVRNIPVARSFGEKDSQDAGRGWNLGVLNSLGLGGIIGASTSKTQNARETRERRNMLDDEDTRGFGTWYESRKRDGTGGSTWSLKSILGGRRSREPSSIGHGTTSSTPWREKTDPFSDGPSLMRDEETGFIAATTRPRTRREMSYASSRSAVSYTDPFSDPIQEERSVASEIGYLNDVEEEDVGPIRLVPRSNQPLAVLRTTLPIEQGGHLLSPLSERTSQSTLLPLDGSVSGSSHAHSNDNSSSPFSSVASRLTSGTAYEPLHSPPSLTSSIISAHLPSEKPMRRSDSWWSRFARTSLLDRRGSDASRRSVGMYDIRDPNPAPRLVTIDESIHSHSPEKELSRSRQSSGGDDQVPKGASQPYGGRHGKSMSSLRTVDSEAIERMAGTMDVVQRVKTGSHRTHGSTSSAGDLSIDTHISDNYDRETDFGAIMYPSPTDMMTDESIAVGVNLTHSPPQAPSPAITASDSQTLTSRMSAGLHIGGLRSPPPAAGAAVAARVQAYERRMSMDQDSPLPTNTRQREERSSKRVSVNYGLVPRASLFVANPDHQLSQSSDS